MLPLDFLLIIFFISGFLVSFTGYAVYTAFFSFSKAKNWNRK